MGVGKVGGYIGLADRKSGAQLNPNTLLMDGLPWTVEIVDKEEYKERSPWRCERYQPPPFSSLR